MDSIAGLINEQDDVLFIKRRREGEQKGRAQKEALVVENLIRQTDFDDSQIANLASVALCSSSPFAGGLASRK